MQPPAPPRYPRAMSYGRSGGGGLKGVMILAMLFVFGGAAYVSGRDFETDVCRPFFQNINVERRLGDVGQCGVALEASARAQKLVLRVKGGAGSGLVTLERTDGITRRAWLTTRDRPEPEMVLGADPMVPTSFIQTR